MTKFVAGVVAVVVVEGLLGLAMFASAQGAPAVLTVTKAAVGPTKGAQVLLTCMSDGTMLQVPQVVAR